MGQRSYYKTLKTKHKVFYYVCIKKYLYGGTFHFKRIEKHLRIHIADNFINFARNYNKHTSLWDILKENKEGKKPLKKVF